MASTVADIETSPTGTKLDDPDPMRGPGARILGRENDIREHRARTMASQLEALFLRLARAEAQAAIERVRTSTFLTRMLTQPVPGDVRKALTRRELEAQILGVLVDNGTAAMTSAVRRASGKRSASPTDRAMREYLAQKTVQLQQIVSSVEEDVRNSVRDVIAAAILEVPRPSVGEMARRIRTQFHGDLTRAGAPREIVPAPETGARVLPTKEYRLTGGGKLYVFSPERAALIARTEMVQAENRGIYDGYEQSGVKWIQWLAYRDGRSGKRRHDEMHRKKVRMGEFFLMPDKRSRGRYPGDSTYLPIGHVANCRCTMRTLYD